MTREEMIEFAWTATQQERERRGFKILDLPREVYEQLSNSHLSALCAKLREAQALYESDRPAWEVLPHRMAVV